MYYVNLGMPNRGYLGRGGVEQQNLTGADPENFSRGGGPNLTYNCGSAQIWKITFFFISSNIGDIKLCKFQGGGGPDPLTPPSPLDPRMFKIKLFTDKIINYPESDSSLP